MSEFITRLTNDVVFKIVFGSKGSEAPLRALLNALLDRGPGERIEQVKIISPGLDRDHLDDKHVILDVRARDQRRGAYNIEVQVASERYFQKRATFYLSKLHSRQLRKGEQYGQIAPSVGICLLDHIRFPERENLHSTYLLRERQHGDVLTGDLQLHFIELPKFAKRDVNDLCTPAEHWLHLLRFSHEYRRGGVPLPEKLMAEDGVAMAYDKMKRAQSREDVRGWVEMREKGHHDFVSGLAGAREDGVLEGLQRGREQGLQEGRQQGLEQGMDLGSVGARRETARRLLSEGLDVALVARSTQFSEAEVEALRNE